MAAVLSNHPLGAVGQAGRRAHDRNRFSAIHNTAPRGRSEHTGAAVGGPSTARRADGESVGSSRPAPRRGRTDADSRDEPTQHTTSSVGKSFTREGVGAPVRRRRPDDASAHRLGGVPEGVHSGNESQVTSTSFNALSASLDPKGSVSHLACTFFAQGKSNIPSSHLLWRRPGAPGGGRISLQ